MIDTAMATHSRPWRRPSALVAAVVLVSMLGCTGAFRAEQLHIEALEHHNRGQHARAAELFIEAAAVPGVSAESRASYLRSAANARYEQRDFTAAHELYDLAARASAPDSTWKAANTADRLVLEGRVAEAITILEAADARHPPSHEVDNPLGLLLLGVHGEQHADAERALLHNQRAFDQNPNPITRFLLARNLAALGQLEQAEAHLSVLVNSHPDNALYEMVLARVAQARQEDPDQPVSIFDLLPPITFTVPTDVE